MVGIERLRDGSEFLLDSVVEKASLVPGRTGHPYNTTDEHKRSGRCGVHWRAGGATMRGARIALKGVIRDALLAEAGEEGEDGDA
jgi:hypothetical protein